MNHLVVHLLLKRYMGAVDVGAGRAGANEFTLVSLFVRTMGLAPDGSFMRTKGPGTNKQTLVGSFIHMTGVTRMLQNRKTNANNGQR